MPRWHTRSTLNSSRAPSPTGRPAEHIGHNAALFLNTVPRAPQRTALGISGALPFSGVDVWTAYELSWLNLRGKPAVAIGTFQISAATANIIESKSMKLYLNALSEARFPAQTDVANALRADLSRACAGPVEVDLVVPGRFDVAELAGESLDEIDAAIEHYSPTAALLRAQGPTVEEALVSNLFKSNCPMTAQPDWASVQIRYRGAQIDRTSLLQYIVSFRQHRAFHEHCVERMYLDICERCRPERLTVYARFTRRGGIDINPFRSNWEAAPPANVRTARQ